MSGNGKVPTANQRSRSLARETHRGEISLAALVGETVSLRLAEVLPPLIAQAIAQAGSQTACLLCVAAHKTAARAHDVDVANALAAAEPEPELSLPEVGRAVTWAPPGAGQPPVPVCYEHLDPSTAAAAARA